MALLEQRPGKQDTLALAAGKGLDGTCSQPVHVEQVERLFGTRDVGPALRAEERHVRCAPQQHVVDDACPRRQDGVLGNERNEPGAFADAEIPASRPKSSARPAHGVTMPAIVCSKVVFPAPFGPTTESH